MIVLDCSAAMGIVRQTEDGKCIKAFFTPREKVITTDLYYIEIVSALSKYVKTGEESLEKGMHRLRAAIALIDEFVPMEEYYTDALRESARLNHSAYDMLYLLLASRKNATLATLDRKLIALCEQQGIDCVHISDTPEVE
ncbi:MAG TPA: toxin PIN [Coriobacteriia bacterium]|nr:toxin PIN [Coriobacteriia bacterium]